MFKFGGNKNIIQNKREKNITKRLKIMLSGI